MKTELRFLNGSLIPIHKAGKLICHLDVVCIGYAQRAINERDEKIESSKRFIEDQAISIISQKNYIQDFYDQVEKLEKDIETYKKGIEEVSLKVTLKQCFIEQQDEEIEFLNAKSDSFEHQCKVYKKEIADKENAPVCGLEIPNSLVEMNSNQYDRIKGLTKELGVQKTELENKIENLEVKIVQLNNQLIANKNEEPQPTPFDLERALAGDDVINKHGVPVTKIAVFHCDIENNIGGVINGRILLFSKNNLFMAPKAKTKEVGYVHPSYIQEIPLNDKYTKITFEV